MSRGSPALAIEVSGSEAAVAHVAWDNYEAGKLAGGFVAEHLGAGGEVGVSDSPPISTLEQRSSGFDDAVEAAGLEVAAHLWRPPTRPRRSLPRARTC